MPQGLDPHVLLCEALSRQFGVTCFCSEFVGFLSTVHGTRLLDILLDEDVQQEGNF